jgi:5'-AMP-activated protein kinase catalytic alpha subunit
LVKKRFNFKGKTLGEGTFGKVRQATHIPSGEKVAIKILEKDKVLDLSDSERINRELHIMRLM